MFSKPVTKFLGSIALALVVCAVASPASAADDGFTVKFTLFSIEGVVVGRTIAIDDKYAEEHGVQIPAPFSFLVPEMNGATALYNTATGTDGMLLKVSFVNAERQLIENIRFVKMRVPMGTTEERVSVLGKLLANDGFNAAVAAYPQSTYIGTRPARIADYDAVEVVGEYLDPELGPMYLRLIGILNPNGPDSIFTVSNIVAARTQLQSIDELTRTFSGTGLKNFKYLDE